MSNKYVSKNKFRTRQVEIVRLTYYVFETYEEGLAMREELLDIADAFTQIGLAEEMRKLIGDNRVPVCKVDSDDTDDIGILLCDLDKHELLLLSIILDDVSKEEDIADAAIKVLKTKRTWLNFTPELARQMTFSAYTVMEKTGDSQ